MVLLEAGNETHAAQPCGARYFYRGLPNFYWYILFVVSQVFAHKWPNMGVT